MALLGEITDPFSGVFGDVRGTGLTPEFITASSSGWLQHLLDDKPLPMGIISVQGRTGSGKTSMMAALAAELNQTAQIFYLDVDRAGAQDVIAAQPVNSPRDVFTYAMHNRDTNAFREVIEGLTATNNSLPSVVFIDSLENSISGELTSDAVAEFVNAIEDVAVETKRSIAVVISHTQPLQLPGAATLRFVTTEVGPGNGQFVFQTACYQQDSVTRVRCARSLTTQAINIVATP